jgi:hypothetical protein
MFLGYNYRIMLKYLVILAVCLGCALVIARHDEYSTLKSTQEAADKNNPALAGKPDENHPQEHVKNTAWDSPSGHIFHNAFRWPEGTTVWAILLTLMAIAEQSNETRKSAESVDKQTKELARQNRNMVRKERARLSVQPPEEDTHLRIDTPLSIGSLRIAVSNLGGTPAINVTGVYEAIVCETENAPTVVQMFQIILPTTIKDGVRVTANPLIIGPRFNNQPVPLHFYLHVRGVITYNDVFRSKPNKTLFEFRRKCMRVKDIEAVTTLLWEESEPIEKST